jgi:transcriptional regulator with PAS, ATPase and Fis domain
LKKNGIKTNGLTEIQAIEKRMIEKLLAKTSITKSAVALGCSRNALLRKMDAYGFVRPEKGRDWRLGKKKKKAK